MMKEIAELKSELATEKANSVLKVENARWSAMHDAQRDIAAAFERGFDRAKTMLGELRAMQKDL